MQCRLGVILSAVRRRLIILPCFSFFLLGDNKPMRGMWVLGVALPVISAFILPHGPGRPQRGRSLSLSDNVFEVVGASTTQEVRVYMNVTGMAPGEAAGATLLADMKSAALSTIGNISLDRLTASFVHTDPAGQSNVLVAVFPEPGGLGDRHPERVRCRGIIPFLSPCHWIYGGGGEDCDDIAGCKVSGRYSGTDGGAVSGAGSASERQLFSLLHSYNFTGCAFYYEHDIFGIQGIPSVVYSPIPSPAQMDPTRSAVPDGQVTSSSAAVPFVERCYCVHRSYTPPGHHLLHRFPVLLLPLLPGPPTSPKPFAPAAIPLPAVPTRVSRRLPYLHLHRTFRHRPSRLVATAITTVNRNVWSASMWRPVLPSHVQTCFPRMSSSPCRIVSTSRLFPHGFHPV